jgi:hypothetical protein
MFSNVDHDTSEKNCTRLLLLYLGYLKLLLALASELVKFKQAFL